MIEQLTRVDATTVANELYTGLRRGMVGVDEQVAQLTENIISNGNTLLEGIPGTGKTTLVSNFEGILVPDVGRKPVGRFQGVGDSLPADITGAMIFNQETGKMEPRLGPVDAHLFFADEINRSPGKTQNAINQAAQEKKVTLGGQDFYLPSPFLVVATQNSHEQGEATYLTTSALLDRFTGSIYFGSPTKENKLDVGRNQNIERELMTPDELRLLDSSVKHISARQLLAVMRVVALTPIEDAALERIIEIEESLVAMKGVALISGDTNTSMGYRFVKAASRLAKANAVRAGKEIATVEQVNEIAPMIFGHRIRSIDHNLHAAYPDKLDVVSKAMSNR